MYVKKNGHKKDRNGLIENREVRVASTGFLLVPEPLHEKGSPPNDQQHLLLMLIPISLAREESVSAMAYGHAR